MPLLASFICNEGLDLFAACRKLLSGVVPLASLPRHEEIVEAVQLESFVVEGAFVESD